MKVPNKKTMSRVIEVFPGVYLKYVDMGNGKYVSQTFTEEAVEQAEHFDNYKELLRKREELCKRKNKWKTIHLNTKTTTTY